MTRNLIRKGMRGADDQASRPLIRITCVWRVGSMVICGSALVTLEAQPEGAVAADSELRNSLDTSVEQGGIRATFLNIIDSGRRHPGVRGWHRHRPPVLDERETRVRGVAVAPESVH